MRLRRCRMQHAKESWNRSSGRSNRREASDNFFARVGESERCMGAGVLDAQHLEAASPRLWIVRIEGASTRLTTARSNAFPEPQTGPELDIQTKIQRIPRSNAPKPLPDVNFSDTLLVGRYTAEGKPIEGVWLRRGKLAAEGRRPTGALTPVALRAPSVSAQTTRT